MMFFNNTKTIFFVFIILNIVIKHVITQSNIERNDPGSLLVDNKLYFAGGYDKEAHITSDFFYLDLTTSFDTKSPPFKEVAKTPFSHR